MYSHLKQPSLSQSQSSQSKELPDLSKEDTKCEYCGVSYLIHSKVKSLEEKVKTLREQLQRYETTSNIEEQLKTEHQTRLEAINADHQKELEEILDRNAARVKEIQSQSAQTISSLQEKLKKKKAASKKLTMELKMVLARVMSQRMLLNQIKAEVQLKMKQVAETVAAIGPPIYTRALALKIEVLEKANAAQQVMDEANQIKHKVEELTTELQDATASSKTAAIQLKIAQNHLSDREKEVLTLTKTVEGLNSNLKKTEQETQKWKKETSNNEAINAKLSEEIAILSQIKQEKEAECATLKSKLQETTNKADEYSKAISLKQNEISAHTEKLATLEKNLTNTNQEKKETISRYQYQISEVEETTKAKIASMRNTFQEQIKDAQTKETNTLKAKEEEFEKALAKTKQDHQAAVNDFSAKQEKLLKDLESQKQENQKLFVELQDEKAKVKVKEVPVHVPVPVPAAPSEDFLPLEVMEKQLLKLGDIVAKKEKEITHLQMIIQLECNERAELKTEISDLKMKLKDMETRK